MKDVQQIEAAVSPKADVPDNTQDILSALPDAPDKEVVEIKENNIEES